MARMYANTCAIQLRIRAKHGQLIIACCISQVVWAGSYEVGCSIVNCPIVTRKDNTPWTDAVIFACDYAPSYVYYSSHTLVTAMQNNVRYHLKTNMFLMPLIHTTSTWE